MRTTEKILQIFDYMIAIKKDKSHLAATITPARKKKIILSKPLSVLKGRQNRKILKLALKLSDIVEYDIDNYCHHH